LAKLKLDMTNVQEGFTLIPEGRYPAYLFNAEHKDSRSGNPMVVLTLKIVKGEFKGRNLWHYVTITPDTLWKVKQTLEALGVAVPKSIVEVDFDDYLGKKCVAVVTHREYQGKTREGVDSIELYESDGNEDESLDIGGGGGGASDDEPPF
jgi:hypothetical protein